MMKLNMGFKICSTNSPCFTLLLLLLRCSLLLYEFSVWGSDKIRRLIRDCWVHISRR